ATLIHLVDGTQDDVAEAWKTVRHELESYGDELGDKTEILALSKVDALDAETRKARAKALAKASGAKVRQVSGVSGEGVTELLREAYALVRRRKGEAARRARGQRPGAGGLVAVSGLGGAKRIVVKVGSALLVGQDGADRHWLAAFAADLARLRARGQQVLVVSSGAVALGRRRLALRKRALTLPEKQAAAAAGQSALMRAWEEALEPHAIAAAQVLLTRDDTEVRRRWLNARATVETLLGLGVIPVVNEYDTVVTEEIRYGDNDRLAARVAQMAGADVLVLLSDVDGLYTADPRQDPRAQ